MEENEELKRDLSRSKKKCEQLVNLAQMEREELSFLWKERGPEAVRRALTAPRKGLRRSVSDAGRIAVLVSSDPEVTELLLYAVIRAVTICCLGKA